MASSAFWTIYEIWYTGPKSNGMVPQWMEETQTLHTCDILQVLELQISDPDFQGKFDYIPYQEYDSDGHWTLQNHFSNTFAYDKAVSFLSSLPEVISQITNGEV